MTKRLRSSLQLTHLMILGSLLTGVAYAQSPASSTSESGIEILKLKWEKQVTLPRNFDPSNIPDNGVLSTMESRTVVPGSTQAPYGDEARRDAANRSAAMAPVDYFPNAPSRMPISYVYSITIRNAGNKTIEAVAWDYLFLDTQTHAVLGNHQVLSYTKVSSATTVTLRGRQRTRPVTVVTAQTAGQAKVKTPRTLEQGVIQCVIYADGSTWKNPRGREGACEVLNRNHPGNQTQRRTAP